jgi:Mor family transcriptional regulator
MEITREQMSNVIKGIDCSKYITDRNNEILQLWLSGKSIDDIAAQYSLTTTWVKSIIMGSNRFGKGGMYKKFMTVKQYNKI